MNLLRSILVIAVFHSALSAQPRVASRHLYERIYAVVLVTGTGKWEDPKRPMFAPTPSQMRAADRSGIIAYHHEISDDGRFALAEFVVANRAALAPLVAQIAQARIAGAQVFQKGVNSQADVETAFKALKKNFDFQKFEVRVP